VRDHDLYTVNAFKRLVDHVFYWPDGYDPVNWPKLSSFDERATWADRNIIGVAFYRWICFVMRGRNPEDNPYLERGG
jgi:hypothetical protein